eukprot:scaffold118090_cov29-Tisochrysis_lutea.AAC.3
MHKAACNADLLHHPSARRVRLRWLRIDDRAPRAARDSHRSTGSRRKSRCKRSTRRAARVLVIAPNHAAIRSCSRMTSVPSSRAMESACSRTTGSARGRCRVGQCSTQVQPSTALNLQARNTPPPHRHCEVTSARTRFPSAERFLQLQAAPSHSSAFLRSIYMPYT